MEVIDTKVPSLMMLLGGLQEMLKVRDWPLTGLSGSLQALSNHLTYQQHRSPEKNMDPYCIDSSSTEYVASWSRKEGNIFPGGLGAIRCEKLIK